MEKPVLETAAQAFAEANANPPFLFDLGPAEGRKVLDGVQSPEIEVPGTVKESLTAPVGPTGTVSVTVFRPAGSASPLPVIFYIHGAGWVFGDDHTHDRLARELAKGVGAAVVFLNYDRSPEARYPVAIEQAYAAARWVVEHGAGHGLGAARMAVAGDSVGQRPGRPGRRRWRWRGAGGGCAGQAGQGAPPGGDALAGEHAEAERERGGARVQGGMAQLLVTGVEAAAGNMSLAGIRARG